MTAALEKARDLAVRLAAGPMQAYAATKALWRLQNESWSASYTLRVWKLARKSPLSPTSPDEDLTFRCGMKPITCGGTGSRLQRHTTAAG